jgi:nitroreductase
MAEGTATGEIGGPPVNKAARGRVDPIPLSSSYRRRPAILQSPRSSACTPIQPLALADHELGLPLRVALLFATLDPALTLAVKWQRRRLPSQTRRRHGSGRR